MPLTISGICAFKDRREASSSATPASTAVKSKSKDMDTSGACGVAGPGIYCRPLTSANPWLLCRTCLFKDAHCLSNSWTFVANGSGHLILTPPVSGDGNSS